MREIQEHKIRIYEFPETDDEEEIKLVKKIKVGCAGSPPSAP
jgi:septin 7